MPLGLDVDLHGFVGFFNSTSRSTVHLNLATWFERAGLTFSLVINFQHVLSSTKASTKALIDDSNLPMQKHFYRSTPSIRCQYDHLLWLDLEV